MAVPISFKCPLTGQVMRDPVATCDGQVFERVAIESWFRHGHRTSPMTGMELESFAVTPQPALRAAIEAFMLHPSTTGKASSDYACECNISHGQPTLGSAAAAAAAEAGAAEPGSEAGADAPALSGIGEDSSGVNFGPATKGLNHPMLATVMESDSEGVQGDVLPTDGGDEAEVKRLLHGLHFQLKRAEKKTEANASASSILAEPIEIAKQILSVVEPHGTPGLRAVQRALRGSSATEKAAAPRGGGSGQATVGSQRAKVQPPSHETQCSDTNSSCPGSATMVCREPSPLRTPKSNGRCSPPRRGEIASHAANAVASGGRASPERQRRKQMSRTGSPLRGADCGRDGRPRRAMSRNPSPEAMVVPAEAGQAVTEATRVGTMRLSSSRGPRRAVSPSTGGVEDGGMRMGFASPTAATQQQQHTLSQAGAQARMVPRKPSEQGGVGRGAAAAGSLPSGARSPAKVGRPVSPGSQSFHRQTATSPGALHKLQREKTGGSNFRHRTTQSPVLGSRCSSNAGNNQQKHRSPSPSRSGNATASPGLRQRPAPTQSICADAGTYISGASATITAVDKRHAVSAARSRPTLMASAANALQQQQQQQQQMLFTQHVKEHLAPQQPNSVLVSPCNSSGISVGIPPESEGKLPQDDRSTSTRESGEMREEGVPVVDEAGRTPLMYAAGEGDSVSLQHQIAMGESVDATDECRCTALMYAATYGHVDTVKCLMEHGAAVEATSKDGWTPLITAAYNGHVGVVHCLLNMNARIEAADERGWTSLMHVAFNGDNSTLRCLLEHRAHVNALDSDGRSALVYAAFNGHVENAKCLLECSKVPPDANGEIPSCDGHRDTALLFAAIHGHLDVVRLLLQGATVAPETRHAAFKLAVDHGHAAVVELLSVGK